MLSVIKDFCKYYNNADEFEKKHPLFNNAMTVAFGIVILAIIIIYIYAGVTIRYVS